MVNESAKPIGWTKDAGWQLGVRRAVPVPLSTVWDYRLGEGLAVWLGETTLGSKATSTPPANELMVGYAA